MTQYDRRASTVDIHGFLETLVTTHEAKFRQLLKTSSGSLDSEPGIFFQDAFSGRPPQSARVLWTYMKRPLAALEPEYVAGEDDILEIEDTGPSAAPHNELTVRFTLWGEKFTWGNADWFANANLDYMTVQRVMSNASVNIVRTEGRRLMDSFIVYTLDAKFKCDFRAAIVKALGLG